MNYSQYFYFIGTTLLLPLWLFMFTKKDKRNEMLFAGVLCGVFSLILGNLYSVMDYWQPVFIFPNFPFEDFYYGFVFGGIGAELSELVLNKRDSKRRRYPLHLSLIIVGVIVTAFTFWILVDVLKLGSITAHILPPLLIGIIIAFIRKDLLISQIVNGFLVAILTFIVFKILLIFYPDIFINHWLMENLSGILISKIPIEELLFSFAVGFGAAGFYEAIFGYSLVKN